MDNKTQILVNIGASVAAKCYQCLRFFLNAAQKSGIKDEEIKEVIQIAGRIGTGALKNMNKFALDSVENSQEDLNYKFSGSCGCS